MAPCLQGQHRPSAQVRVTWRFDAPDSTAMLTPRRSSSLAAFTQLRCLHDNFDAALVEPRETALDHPAVSAEAGAVDDAAVGRGRLEAHALAAPTASAAWGARLSAAQRADRRRVANL